MIELRGKFPSIIDNISVGDIKFYYKRRNGGEVISNEQLKVVHEANQGSPQKLLPETSQHKPLLKIILS